MAYSSIETPEILEDLTKIIGDEPMAGALKNEMKNEVRLSIREGGDFQQTLLVRYNFNSDEYKKLEADGISGMEKVFKSFFYITRTNLDDEVLKKHAQELVDDKAREKKKHTTLRSLCFKSLNINGVNFHHEAYIQLSDKASRNARKSTGSGLKLESKPIMYKQGILYLIKPFSGLSIVNWTKRNAAKNDLVNIFGQMLFLVEDFRDNQILHRRLNPDSIKISDYRIDPDTPVSETHAPKIQLNNLDKLRGSALNNALFHTQNNEDRKIAKVDKDHDEIFRSPELLISEIRRNTNDYDAGTALDWQFIAEAVDDAEKKERRMYFGPETDYFNIGLIMFNLFRSQFAKPMDKFELKNGRITKGDLIETFYETNTDFVTAIRDARNNTGCPPKSVTSGTPKLMDEMFRKLKHGFVLSIRVL